MKEIVVSNPILNNDYGSDWSFRHASNTAGMFKEFQTRRNVTPETHPLVCDLFAGQGGVSAVLLEQGWSPENITCIDIGKPSDHFISYGDWPSNRKALVRKWRHWDLSVLAAAISEDKPLPSTVRRLRNRFDVVVAGYPDASIPPREYLSLMLFFAKDLEDCLTIPMGNPGNLFFYRVDPKTLEFVPIQ